MVRRSTGAATYREVDSDDSGDNYSDDQDQYVKPKKSTPKKGGSAKKSKSGPRGKISPSKTPASKRSRFATMADYNSDDDDDDDQEEEYYRPSLKKKKGGSARKPAPKKRSKYQESDDEQESESEEEEEQDSDDDYYSKKKKGSPKKKPAPKSKKKGGKKSSPKKKKGGSKGFRTTTSDEDSDDEIVEVNYRRKMKTPNKKIISKPKEVFPPVSEMVVDSIKALKDHPKKGSTLGSIKETILLNWDINMNKYLPKIKKYIINAVETGDLIQVKGNKLRGRWTVPGMKPPKRKRRKKDKDEKFDEDEVEYVAPKTKRDEDRVKDQMELERRREERAVWLEKVAADKASRPKKPPKPKQETWEVESIKGHKVVGGKDWFLVKYDGPWKPQWEPEENVEGCMELIEQYLDQKEKDKEEKERIVREAQESGVYEVARILDVQFLKNKTREFLIRWKGWGADGDTWEAEDNLDCQELIDAFMAKYETLNTERSLRIAPKKVERVNLNISQSKRQRKLGFQISYADMDD